MRLARILVLGVTFFAVALCPRVECAICVFTLATAIYSFLWGVDIIVFLRMRRYR